MCLVCVCVCKWNGRKWQKCSFDLQHRYWTLSNDYSRRIHGYLNGENGRLTFSYNVYNNVKSIFPFYQFGRMYIYILLRLMMILFLFSFSSLLYLIHFSVTFSFYHQWWFTILYIFLLLYLSHRVYM